MRSRTFSVCAALLCWLPLGGCGVYSFTGADTGLAETIQVRTFLDDAGTGPSNLAINFTESLREFYQRNTDLGILIEEPGDLLLEGEIVGYELSPVAPQGGDDEAAAQNRLTLTVSVNYVNTLESDKDFESRFSAYEDFPQNQDLSTVEQVLIEELSERIILDIFNKSVADW
ncbi:MAG: LptE family protein [Catalinimonas sp.]